MPCVLVCVFMDVNEECKASDPATEMQHRQTSKPIWNHLQTEQTMNQEGHATSPTAACEFVC